MGTRSSPLKSSDTDSGAVITKIKEQCKMKFFSLLLFLFCGLILVADDTGNKIQVKVSTTAEKNTFSLKKQLESEGKKAAVKKYILQLNATTPEKLIEEACNEYENFVDAVYKVSEKWEPLDKIQGQLVGEYQVTLNLEKINQWLEKKGFKQQAGIELIVMEEPPALGQMKIDKAFGNDIDGEKFFMQNYTTFQRRLRDAIVKKVGTFGFDVKLLADNDQYEKFKTKDGTLVGVYFDVNSNNFAVDRDLLKAVKENNPDTLVLYYRIDALIFEASTSKIRATVAFNMKDLNTGVTKSIGSQSFEFVSKAKSKDMVIDDIAYCAEAAMNSLMNAEGAAAKLNNIAMSIKNTADMPKRPLKLIVNASAFDAKIRKKALYTLKKELIAQKITTADKIKSSNTTLTATIDNPNIKEADALYMEHVSPILEKIGITLDDDKVNYAADTVTIKP